MVILWDKSQRIQMAKSINGLHEQNKQGSLLIIKIIIKVKLQSKIVGWKILYLDWMLIHLFFKLGKMGGDMKITQVLILLIQKFRNKFNSLSLFFPQTIPMLNREPGKFIDNDNLCDTSF